MPEISVADALPALDAALEELPNRPAVFLLWPKQGEPYLAKTTVMRRRLLRLLRLRLARRQPVAHAPRCWTGSWKQLPSHSPHGSRQGRDGRPSTRAALPRPARRYTVRIGSSGPCARRARAPSFSMETHEAATSNSARQPFVIARQRRAGPFDPSQFQIVRL